MSYHNNKKYGNEIWYTNYNLSFANFFNQYKELAIDIIEKDDILDINMSIFAFFSTYNYGILDNDKKKFFLEEIYRLNQTIRDNENFNLLKRKILEKGISFRIKAEYYKQYYNYMFKHLRLLSEFSESIEQTFMPQKTRQSRYVKFVNNEPFYENIYQIHSLVANSIKDFTIFNFVGAYNSVLAYYSMFYLFIHSSVKDNIEKTLSIILSQILHKDVVNVLSKTGLGQNDKDFIRELEYRVFIQINYVNSKINESFSNYSIFPKIQKKIYVDNTLI